MCGSLPPPCPLKKRKRSDLIKFGPYSKLHEVFHWERMRVALTEMADLISAGVLLTSQRRSIWFHTVRWAVLYQSVMGSPGLQHHAANEHLALDC